MKNLLLILFCCITVVKSDAQSRETEYQDTITSEFLLGDWNIFNRKNSKRKNVMGEEVYPTVTFLSKNKVALHNLKTQKGTWQYDPHNKMITLLMPERQIWKITKVEDEMIYFEETTQKKSKHVLVRIRK